ncbi:MAG: hypothetical protein ACI9Y1_002207 [Lentisphaeria bacterium]|jgi:hypothetical protein
MCLAMFWSVKVVKSRVLIAQALIVGVPLIGGLLIVGVPLIGEIYSLGIRRRV